LNKVEPQAIESKWEKLLQKGKAKDGKNYKTKKEKKKRRKVVMPTQQTIAAKSAIRNISSFSVFQLN
jgi:hypothetical protein